MKAITLIIKTSSEMEDLGYKIGLISFPNMILALNGDLSAGKTTMTKGVGKALGVKEIINSPTFTILKIYQGKFTMYHFDVYRITNAMDDFELEEYFDLGGISIIEWADNIKELLPNHANGDNLINIDYQILDNGDRLVKIQGPDVFMNQLKELI